MKATAEIHDWIVYFDNNGVPLYLEGKVKNHTNQSSFHADRQRTSRIVSYDVELNQVETENTIYTLGTPANVVLH